MAYKAVILPGARQDLKDAASWYNEQQEGLGKRFLESVKREVWNIIKNPYLYEVRYDDVRTALTETFSYLIHFSIDKQTIIIKAVYHTSRNSEIWKQEN